jgi:hypothetical protein
MFKDVTRHKNTRHRLCCILAPDKSFVNLKITFFANYYKKRHSSESLNLNIKEIPHLHFVSCGMTEWSVANPKEIASQSLANIYKERHSSESWNLIKITTQRFRIISRRLEISGKTEKQQSHHRKSNSRSSSSH